MNSLVHPFFTSLAAANFQRQTICWPRVVREHLLGGKRMSARMIGQFVLVLVSLVLISGARADEVENAKEVEGFWGTVTGEVKSAQADGRAFVLTITKAEFDPASSALKDNAPLIGKELTIGTRMPKTPQEVSYPHADDVAYIKTLKPGMRITVKIFAPRSSPRVLRIQAPGKSV
jgi:hypothetical protein